MMDEQSSPLAENDPDFDLNSEGNQPRSPDNSGKPRKRYTISKQREVWTDEEHTKFLEALKL